MSLKRLLALLAFAFASCSSTPPLPVTPQIQVDPSGFYFGTDLGSGTFDTVIAENSIQITNGGQNPLTINSVTESGGSGVFTVQGPSVVLPDGGSSSGTPLQLASQQTAFVQVTFSPPFKPQPVCYLGTLTITSNAANGDGGTVVLPIQGAGIPELSDGGIVGSADGGPVCPIVVPLTDGG